MQQSQWEIIILKPTHVFLSFLASQNPHVELPELSLLQTDATAYAIHRQASEEETLEEIERHFSLMFKHEVSRWLGDDHDELNGSFLDFLCCFKFEMHSQIVLMESSMTDAHHLLCIKPRSVLVKCKENLTTDQDQVVSIFEPVNLAHLPENATVVVKNFGRLSEIKPFIKHYYRPIFNAEMSRMSEKADQWPAIDSIQTFSRYFAVEVHTQLIHLH